MNIAQPIFWIQSAIFNDYFNKDITSAIQYQAHTNDIIWILWEYTHILHKEKVWIKFYLQALSNYTTVFSIYCVCGQIIICMHKYTYNDFILACWPVSFYFHRSRFLIIEKIQNFGAHDYASSMVIVTTMININIITVMFVWLRAWSGVTIPFNLLLKLF